MTTEPKTLVTAVEAAKMLGVCRATVYNLISTGELHRVKIGRAMRLQVSELHDLVARNVQPAPETVE